MFTDDLRFGDDYGSLDSMCPQPIADCGACAMDPVWECQQHVAEAEMTVRACSAMGELKRQREANVEDKRTTDLAKMLSIANRLTALNCDVTNLTLHDDNESLQHLQRRIANAERLANDIYQEASNG